MTGAVFEKRELPRFLHDATIGSMEIGLVLPTIGPGAGRDSLMAGAETAQRLGWSSIWVTDHLMVPSGPEADEYGTILEALVSLSYVSAGFPDLVIGTSAIVPPLRNSVILAKELATLDLLSEGRLVVGVGVADDSDLPEFRNVGAEHRFRTRGALVDETIALWRHLWGGSVEPFVGEFHNLEDYVFLPLPPQRGELPIWTGGRSARAIRRAATLADGYHAAQTGPDDLLARVPELERLSSQVGRARPTLSVRSRVRFDRGPGRAYTMHGSAKEISEEVRRFAEVGTEHLIVVFEETDPERIQRAAERFHHDAVVPALG